MDYYNLGLDPSKEEQEQQQQPDLIEQAAEQTQAVEKPRGFISELGDFVEGLAPLNIADTVLEKAADLTKDIPIVGDAYQTLSDFVPSQEEQMERVAEVPVVGKPIVALSAGANQGAMTAIGLTPAAAIFNQQAAWNERPQVLKDDDLFSNVLYEGAKVIAPMVIWRGAGMKLKGAAQTRALESYIESLGQDSAEDLIAGRWGAKWLGKAYASLVQDEEAGAKFTEDLIKGDSLAVQPFLRTWAAAQNYGFSLMGEGMFKALGAAGDKLLRNIAYNRGNVDQVAKALNVDEDTVVKALSDVRQPPLSPDAEPSDTVTAATVGRQLNPTKNITNEAALNKKFLAETAGNPVDLDDMSNYFYDWSKISSSEDMAIELSKAFFNKELLEAGSVARQRVLRGAAQWLLTNDLTDDNTKEFLESLIDTRAFLREGAPELTEPLSEELAKLQAEGYEIVLNPMKKPANWDTEFLQIFEDNYEINLNSEAGLQAIAILRYVGEQNGAELVDISRNLLQVEKTGGDITNIVENIFLPKQKLTRSLLTPLRKAKRSSYLIGETQQDEFASDIADLLGVDRPRKKPGTKVTGEEAAKKQKKKYLTIDGERVTINLKDSEIAVDSIEELWNQAKSGNDDAKKLFSLVLQNLRFGDPKKVIGNLELSTRILEEALQTQNFKAAERYMYNVMALGQIATPVNAIGATLFRQSLEPLALAGTAINPLNRNVKPKEALYGLGQFVGGLYHGWGAIRAAYRGFATNSPASGKDRFSENYNSQLWKDFTDNMAQSEEMIRKAEGWHKGHAILMAAFRGMAFAPFPTNIPTRVLMAADEGGQVTAAAQVAWGRTFLNAWDNPEFSGSEFRKMLQAEEKKVFRGPAYKGLIIDPEAQAVANRQTLQQPFEFKGNKVLESNIIQDYFAAGQKANEISIVQRLFNMFPRPVYRQLEQEYAENILGSLPGVRKWNKTIQKIEANPDPAQRMALHGQISLAQGLGVTGLFAVMAHQFGEDIMGIPIPKIQITDGKVIIEGEEYDHTLDFSKFSPASVWLGILSNITESFITGESSEQATSDKMAALITASFEDIVRRNLLQGPQKMARLFDTRSEAWFQNTGEFISEFISPGIIKEFVNVLQPYETVKDVRTDPVTRLATGANQVIFGGLGMPRIWDIYAKSKTEYPKPKVATNDPEDINKVRGAMLGSYLWPGKVEPQRYYDPVVQAMKKVDYSISKEYLRQIQGVELTGEQQSLLSKEIQGKLYPALKTFVERDYPKLINKYRKTVEKEGRESSNADTVLYQIRVKFNSIHDAVKREAIRSSELYNDPLIKQSLAEDMVFGPQNQGPIRAERQGLYANAAQQGDTPLAKQVRDLLDFA
jgi:hypothetical protein